ncbi:MAG: transcription-repair coupling factor [Oscillospiraceae bacterium]|nr:transcription-repair coupling factor [Oscillospiraceae bacterium]
MDLLLKILPESEEFRKLLTAVGKKKTVALSGVGQLPRSHMLATLHAHTGRPIVALCQDDTTAHRVSEELQAFLGMPVALLPGRDWTFYCVSGVSRQWEQKRMELLYALSQDQCPVLVSSYRAMTMRTMPKEKLLDCALCLSCGMELSIEALLSHLVNCGYSRSELVEGVGQFSVRGGIVDLFSPGMAQPVRMEFFGDEIDAMGFFDPMTQRRTDNVEQILLLPVAEAIAQLHPQGRSGLVQDLRALIRRQERKKQPHELLLRTLREDAEAIETGSSFTASDRYLSLIYPDYACAADYLSDRSILCICDHGNLSKAAERDVEEEGMMLDHLLSGGILCGELCSFSKDWDSFCMDSSGRGAVFFDTFLSAAYPEELKPKELLSFTAKQLPAYGGNVEVAANDLSFYQKNQYGTVVLCGNQRRGELLQQQLQEKGIKTRMAFPLVQLPLPGQILLTDGTLPYGIEYPQLKYAVITEGQLTAQATKKPLKKHQKSSNRQKLESFTDLNPGDLIVHDDYGIGRFVCMEQVIQDGAAKDYIKIAYLGDGMLYVPATRLDLIAKYIGGGEDGAVKLNRLGGGQWEKTKARARSCAKDMAQQLIKLYAQRKRLPGYSFASDSPWQKEFEDNFEYVETEDQLRCIREIKADMEASYPMDRLLCGDVGFGKTEVALRGAMKAILDGKQVAILVPTTVLAQQHYTTAMARFRGFPVNIGVLSRFCPPAQVKQTIADLRSGTLDLLVGTHKLLQKEVQFRDLGLLIVDEEQRFGVTHKEKLKELSQGVDVLTLSATPIPRTLNMALTGIRDLSTLEEPPRDRFPVQTFVLEHNDMVLFDAMRRELERGGQVYYMHNRVQSIDRCAAKIKEAFPYVNVGVAHGKLSEGELSQTMQDLIDGEIRILVCTTIIETGIDNPNVNTLIIEDADRLGLAQLHQIRGRVGRSNRHAFAYMTYRPGKVLTEIAEKRLNAIRDYAEFGSGFKIAMRDLEIRGAGNLLGAEQSGHMIAVGYDMYLRLLEEAVLEEKGEPKEKIRNCTADINVTACIEPYYVKAGEQRMDLYRRMAAVRNKYDADELLDEIVDRYGEPPKGVMNLIHIALLRGDAATLGITEIRQFSGALHFQMEQVDLDRVEALEKQSLYRRRLSLSAKDGKVVLKLVLREKECPLKSAQLLVKALEKTE